MYMKCFYYVTDPHCARAELSGLSPLPYMPTVTHILATRACVVFSKVETTTPEPVTAAPQCSPMSVVYTYLDMFVDFDHAHLVNK